MGQTAENRAHDVAGRRNRLRHFAGLCLIEFYEWAQMAVSILPGAIGVRARRAFYGLFLRELGPGLKMGTRGRVQCPGAVSIGAHSGINDNAWIAANSHPDGWISIGDKVLIGPSVIIHSGNHEFGRTDLPIKHQGGRFAPIVIEDDVWIAAHSVILGGTVVRRGTVVAAGAVVTRSTEPYSIVAGVPARAIGRRSPEQVMGD